MNNPFQGTSIKNTQDFFAPFELKQKQSRDSKSQHSSAKNIKAQQTELFNGFDFGQQSVDKQKISSEKPDFMNPYENEKTVKSRSQHSFDFSQL